MLKKKKIRKCRAKRETEKGQEDNSKKKKGKACKSGLMKMVLDLIFINDLILINCLINCCPIYT